MRKSFDGQLAQFVRKARGEMSYARFAKKTGLAAMTLFRVEKREIHLSLDKLETMVNKLRIKLSDVFPDEF
jgi:transcriptional regulator with XRE-family HTH domain